VHFCLAWNEYGLRKPKHYITGLMLTDAILVYLEFHFKVTTYISLIDLEF